MKLEVTPKTAVLAVCTYGALVGLLVKTCKDLAISKAMYDRQNKRDRRWNAKLISILTEEQWNEEAAPFLKDEIDLIMLEHDYYYGK